MLNITLYFMESFLPNDTTDNVAGDAWCLVDVLNRPFQLAWSLNLNGSLATQHQALPTASHEASPAKREASPPWVSTPDSPEKMCSNDTDGTMVAGNGTSSYSAVMSDCSALQAAYNDSYNGYYNISIKPEDRADFIVLANHGVCTLSVLALDFDNTTGSVSFR